MIAVIEAFNTEMQAIADANRNRRSDRDQSFMSAQGQGMLRLQPAVGKAHAAARCTSGETDVDMSDSQADEGTLTEKDEGSKF